MDVGDEIDCTCPRCRTILTHVILYFQENGHIGNVECRTCGLHHPYRSYRARRFRRLPPTAESLIPLIEGGSFEERLSRLDETKTLMYSMEESYRANDAIDHPRFGVGFVLRARESRIEVLFEEGIKVLVHKGTRN